jgi:hypothetical protein
MSDSGEVETGDSGSGTALHYSLCLFYILIASFIIVIAWIIPNIQLAASVTFTLLGAILFIAAIVQVVYVSEMGATLCASCPAPSTNANP